MIVRPNGATQLLITQPDHAALAARIMRQWQTDGLLHASRRAAILLAVEEHDNGWREADAAPIVDDVSGAILDFTGAPDAIRRGVWPRGVARLSATPYAAALVAQHAVHVYRRYRSHADWAAFFATMEAARDHHAQEAGSLAREDLLREYFFLRVGDLASLVFCNAWTDAQTDDAGSGYSILLDGTRLTIAPDPFEGEEVLLEIAARELPVQRFRSQAEAREAWSAAPTVVVTGIASGRQAPPP